MKTHTTNRLLRAGRLPVLALALCSALIFSGCTPYVEEYTPPKQVSKKIVMKVSPTEQRMSFDPFDNQSLRRRASTVYYLVAEDGTAVEVGLSAFAKAKEGDVWTAQETSWRQVQ